MNQLDPNGGEQHQFHYAGQELRYDRRDHALSQPARDQRARSSVVNQPQAYSGGKDRKNSAQFNDEVGVRAQILRETCGQRNALDGACRPARLACP